jgi:hypothetical protein
MAISHMGLANLIMLGASRVISDVMMLIFTDY